MELYIERDLTEQFRKISEIYPIVAIVGARQSGKTTFLREQSKHLKSSYLLFDDPDVRELFDEDVKKFENQYLDGFSISILDEVQYCKDAGRNLKYLADKGRKLWITSSSETILSKEVLSFLVGRVSILKLYPFSLTEFLQAKKQKEFSEKILKRAISEHILYGGYPKVVITHGNELKKIILKDLYETMVLKDVAKIFSIDNLTTFEKVIRYFSHTIGGLISYDDISKNIAISFQTLKKYIDSMEKSYFIFKIQPFFSNKTKEIVKQPKIYFVDCGMRNIVAKSFDIEGKLFENYVATELLKKGFLPKYWRTKAGAEVDFVIEKGKELIPIEVKLNSSKITRSMRSFIELYKPNKAIIVYYKGEEKKVRINNCTIFFTHVMGIGDLLVNRK